MKKIGLLFTALLIVALAAAWLIPSWAVTDTEAEACLKGRNPKACVVFGAAQHPNADFGVFERGCTSGIPPTYANCDDCCDTLQNDPDCEKIVGTSGCYCTTAAFNAC